jgi:hypothetical protein
VNGVEDKGAIFLIGAVSLALAALAWRSVSRGIGSDATAQVRAHH